MNAIYKKREGWDFIQGRIWIIFLFGTLLFTHGVLSAQTSELYFENYTSYDGLSQNSVFSIAQDANGFMWFATQDGLNRYDGKEFKVYLPQNEMGRKLPSNHISSLFFDTDENLLWVGTVRGVSLYQPEKDSLSRVIDLFPFAGELERLPVTEIKSFREGEYWIISQNQGLLQLNTQSEIVRSYFSETGSESRVNSIVSHEGSLIVSVGEQLYSLLPEGTYYGAEPLNVQYPFSEIRELYSYRNVLWIGTSTQGCFYIEHVDRDPVVHACEAVVAGGIGGFIADTSGNLWIGTRGNGLIRYNPDTQTSQTARHDPNDNRSIGRNFVLSTFKDRQDIIWLGLSGGGVAKYDPLKYQFTTWSNEPANEFSLADNMVFEIYKSSSGQHYAGTQNRGFVKWDFDSGRFHSYPEFSSPGVPENTIYDVTESPEGTLWIASWGGLIGYDEEREAFSFYGDQNLLTSEKLYAIHKLDYADSLFITGENGPAFFSLNDREWKQADKNLLQENAHVGRFIHEDKTGVLWITTEGAGLVKYDYQNGEYEIIEPVRKISTSSRHLFHDGGLFWLATDDGIVIYDPEKEIVVKHITVSEGNTSNVIYAIQKDTEGYFWASSNVGLYKIDPETYTLQQYDLGNGLSFLEYNTASTLAEADGTLLFGGVGGITTFNPPELRENEFSPAPLITSILVNDEAQPMTGSESLSLKYNQNFITIQYAVNNFSNQERNRFEYRLQGLSDQWIDNGNDNTTVYNSLPSGDYTFQVKSANSDGKWSEDFATLGFVIHPVWWQTWWFRISVLLTIICGVIFLVRRRVKAIRHEAEMIQKIAETEMTALRAQMNPHFIFNCINSIDAFIQSNDKYQATIYLSKFAKLLRNVLDNSSKKTVRLSKDLETLELYVELERLRNDNKFSAEIEADNELLQNDYRVPPLVVQPYVENAILHGLKHKEGTDGNLKITITKKDEQIKYIIEDNGVGRNGVKNGNPKGHRSYGMQMSGDRVKFFNNEEDASVKVTDLTSNGKPAGTRVEVLLKLK